MRPVRPVGLSSDVENILTRRGENRDKKKPPRKAGVQGGKKAKAPQKKETARRKTGSPERSDEYECRFVRAGSSGQRGRTLVEFAQSSFCAGFPLILRSRSMSIEFSHSLIARTSSSVGMENQGRSIRNSSSSYSSSSIDQRVVGTFKYK